MKILNRQSKDEEFSNGYLTKAVSLLIIAGVIGSTLSALTSLNTDPGHAKYVAENVSTTLGFAAAGLTFLLSSLQKNIYWVSRGRKLKLDERQVAERQDVFERSYKWAALIIWLFVVNVPSFTNGMSDIMKHNFNTVPGHLYAPLYNLAILFFALPLIIAVWRKD